MVYKFFDKKTSGSEEIEFYKTHLKRWLKDNDIEINSTHNEGKSVVAEKFIKTLKNKIYKHMALVSKNNFIIKILEVNNKDLKFQVGDHVRISKYKNIFAKGYTPNWPEEVFVIKEVKNTVPWTYAINDLNGEQISGTFYEKKLQKTSQ